jgi:hypothetical protein
MTEARDLFPLENQTSFLQYLVFRHGIREWHLDRLMMADVKR